MKRKYIWKGSHIRACLAYPTLYRMVPNWKTTCSYTKQGLDATTDFIMTSVFGL